MRKRPITKVLPGLESLEPKQLLSGGSSTAHPIDVKPGARALASHPADQQGGRSPRVNADKPISAEALRPHFGFLVFRITNPTLANNHLTPPFSHVLVQARQPVPGQVYNVLSIAVRNGTTQTFDASSGFTVMFPGQKHATPILTGDQQWQPGQEFVFYVLTKKYYPLPNQVTSGFRFVLGGAPSIGIPGPSGIFLRLKYNPATIGHQLDQIVAFGQGAQGGVGIKFGLPDTAIYEFVSAKLNRNDFGGYF